MSFFDNLLARGYFPVQLPPGFTTIKLASEREHYEGAWADKKVPRTLAERFSVPRSSYYRRSTALLNPIAYYHLAKDVAEFWPKIQGHYAKSNISRSIPGDDGSLRAIRLTKFSELHEDKVMAASGYKFALITDISSFFPTIYTHTIPWALHGKEVAKKKQQKTPAYYGNILDGHCMQVQDGQTIGLPIGPDTSHVIAEIIGVAIDGQLKAALGSWPQGFRYVDDFYFFFNTRDEAERALAVVVRAVGSFELQINPAKTRIVEVREIVEESWKYSVKKLDISSQLKRQRDDIHHYFETLLSLEKRFKDESIVKYGLKRLSSMIVKKQNWKLLQAYLFKCGYGFPNTIQIIAHFLATYHHHKYPIDRSAVRRFCNNLISASAASDHHGEVAWLLWICKELKVPVNKDAALEVVRMGSPVCTLILLDLYHSKVIKTSPAESDLAPHASDKALLTSSWLLAYEAGRRKWLGNADTTFIEADPFFGPLLDAGVGFYDQERKLPPMFRLKKKSKDVKFDTDEDIAEQFDFDEMDEEYFDSSDEFDDEDFEADDGDEEED